MSTAEAWFLYRGEGEQADKPGQLQRETFELSACEAGEVIAEPIYGCWEGNMGHAVQRRPIDICRHRNEEKVVLGNAGVLRVVEVGRGVKGLEPGQCGVLFGSSEIDNHGYPKKMLGYDAPHTMGCLATRVKLKERELIPLPTRSRFSLAQWAAFSVRYITAWANWRVALGVYRLMLTEDEDPHPHVWGWGGGTTLAELELALRAGCQTAMLSGDNHRLKAIANAGIVPIDRRQFGDLSFDEQRFYSDLAYRRAYTRAETAFVSEVERRTEGQGVGIFVDYIGTPVLRVTLKALGRIGVVTTAGWKDGMIMNYLRAAECISRHQHIHTHYARYAEGVEAVEFAERAGWIPSIDEKIFAYDRIPELAETYATGGTGMFPVYAVNPE